MITTVTVTYIMQLDCTIQQHHTRTDTLRKTKVLSQASTPLQIVDMTGHIYIVW